VVGVGRTLTYLRGQKVTFISFISFLRDTGTALDGPSNPNRHGVRGGEEIEQSSKDIIKENKMNYVNSTI